MFARRYQACLKGLPDIIVLDLLNVSSDGNTNKAQEPPVSNGSIKKNKKTIKKVDESEDHALSSTPSSKHKPPSNGSVKADTKAKTSEIHLQTPSEEPITHWLMKAEPDSRIVKGKDVKFSIDDLREMGTSPWDGVRNHQAKNFMKDKMKLGQKVLFYHSNTKIPGVAGVAEIAKEGYIDHTAFDPSHPYYDEKSDKAKPSWYMVDVKYVGHLNEFVPLKTAQTYDGPELKNMVLIKRGRLSVQPVTKIEFDTIIKLGGGIKKD